MSRSHRGRKGDGWPRARVAIDGPLASVPARPHTYPDVCPRDACCGHVVCSIVWYCMENT